MGKTIAITGINSYFASTILPKLQNDPDIEKIIGIDVTPWKGGYNKVVFYINYRNYTRVGDGAAKVNLL